MGYLSKGKYHQTENYGKNLQEEIDEETKRLYYGRYGKRNPDTLSTLELDKIRIEAAQIVQRRRRRK